MFKAVIVFKTEDGKSDCEVKEFVTERGAKLYVTEESKWENTLSASVWFGNENIFELEGDFA